MRTFIVVELKVALQALFQLRHRGILVQVDVFIFDGAPEPLHEDIVQGTPTTVHAHTDPRLLQARRECLGGELGALVGVKDVRLPLCQRSIKSFQAETPIQGVESCQVIT